MVTIDYSRDALLDPFAIRTLKDRYMIEGEKSPQDAFARAASAFADDEAHAQRLYDYVSKLWFMFSTPVLANGGTKRGLPISCFLSHVEDSLAGIIDHEGESSWLAAMGGGLGASWSALRTNKTKTSRGGESTGAIPFIAQFDRKVLAYRQAGTRRAAYAAYLNVSHPEIIEFVSLRKPTGGAVERKALNLHHAVNIPDAFMEKLFAEDDSWELKDPHSSKVTATVSARELWQKILTMRVETGEPYIHFIDTSNRALPQEQKNLKLFINNSNLCVAPETLLLTKEYGYIAIKDVVDMEVKVWNGQEWSTVTPKKTGVDKELLRVTFSDGTTIDCTPEHKFYVLKDYGQPSVEVCAKDLKPMDKLEKFNLPEDYSKKGTIEGVDWYSQGFYAGDGNEGYNFSWVYEPKSMCIPRLKGNVSTDRVHNRYRWDYKAPIPKFLVPRNLSTENIADWLSGLLDADGCVVQSTKGLNIQLTSINYIFLKEIRLMLQELGISTALTLRREAGKASLPKNDGSGEYGEYECEAVWLLNFNGASVIRLLHLGLNCSRLTLDSSRIPNRDASRFLKVACVERTGRISDTYCATEPKRNRLMFNGVLTGNCAEIVLPTSAERTAVCCLSSVNLEKWDEWKDTQMVGDLIRMLDNVLDVFIKAENLSDAARQSIRRATFSASMERSLGLGAMGFHSYLQKNMIPMESEKALEVNKEIFFTIRTQAEAATDELGVVKGSCPDYINGGGVGARRNMHLLAIAPNASSSILCGNTSPSIEPYSTNSFSQRTENGTNIFKNPHLTQLFKDKGNTDEDIKSLWRSISAKKGSCQHLDCLTEEEKAVFKTAYEINPQSLVDLAAARQVYIDQAQSLNLFLTAPIPVQMLHDIHYNAWKQGVKTLYYLRTSIEKTGEDIGQKLERNKISTGDLTTSADADTFVQTQFKTVTKTGFEIECVGCSG